jgi:hypothetical protein
LLVEGPLEFLQIFAEQIFLAQLAPSPEVVDLAALREAIFFENPVDLFLFAPHEVPVLTVRVLPLAAVERLEDAVAEGGLELDALAG